MAVDFDTLKEAYTYQLTNGCNAFQCTVAECRSCPNFIFANKTEEQLDELAEGFATQGYDMKGGDHEFLCPCLSPVLFDLSIYEDLSNFNIFLSEYSTSRSVSNSHNVASILSHRNSFVYLFSDDVNPLYPDAMYLSSDAVRDFIQAYSSHPRVVSNSRFQKNFDQTFTYLLSQTVPVTTSLPHIRSLFVCLVLSPLIPKDPDFVRLMFHITRLLKPAKDLFVQLLSMCPSLIAFTLPAVQRVINGVSTSAQLLRTEPTTICPIEFLSLLFQANTIISESNPDLAIPKHFFINEKICSVLKPDEEFIAFAQKNFSFLNFPMILTLPFKAHVRTVESEFLMKQCAMDFLRDAVLSGNMTISINQFVFKMKVRRQRLLHDTMSCLLRTDVMDLRKKLMVEFEGEAAVDAGGVSREFFTLVTNELFSPDYAMFELVNNRFYWFMLHMDDFPEYERYYRVLGMFVGLAISNSVILPIRFPVVFYKKLLGMKTTLQDYAELDEQAANTLKNLLVTAHSPDPAKRAEIADYGLFFELSLEILGANKVFPLKPNGGEIPITAENADEYVSLYVDWKLNKSVQQPFEEFKGAFDSLVGTPVMKMFTPEELDELVSGREELDWNALKKGTIYKDGYTAKSKSIKLFWQVFNEWNEEQKVQMLYFITGTKRAPVGGLEHIRMKITKMANSDRLPMAHTCFNDLNLPDYGNINVMRQKLAICLQNCDGFGMR